MIYDGLWPLILAAAYLMFFGAKDQYVVVREYRIVQPGEYGKGKSIEASFVHGFDDYHAARAFFDMHEGLGGRSPYENQQNVNYLYAVHALTAAGASRKMSRKVHHAARLLVETPFEVLAALKRQWDEERRIRAEMQSD